MSPWELPLLAVLVVGMALLLKTFVVQAFYIPSQSMEQTLLVGDRVLVNKLVYDFRDVHRGEVVVFKGPPSWEDAVVLQEPENLLQRGLREVGQLTGFGPPDEKDFIKRVIAVAGDTVACCDEQGRVTVTPPGGEPVALDESAYVYQDNSRPFEPVTVPEGRVWVMGDHRSQSADSRYHVADELNGTVPVENVIGRAFVVLFPFDRVHRLPVPETFDGEPLEAAAALGSAPLVAP